MPSNAGVSTVAAAETAATDGAAGIQRFLDGSEAVAERLLAAPRVRLLCHYDGDGLCGGGLIAGALHRAGVGVQVTAVTWPSKEILQRLVAEDPPLVVTVDIGSGQLDALGALPCEVIILDHHVPAGTAGPKITQLNPRLEGLDGSFGACGTTVAFLVALGVDEANWSSLPTALAGIIADRQHLGGVVGLNALLLEQAKARGLVRTVHGMALQGPDVLSALCKGVDPYVVRYVGNEEQARRRLEALGIDATLPLAALSDQQHATLASHLALALLEQDVAPAVIEDCVTELWRLPDGSFAHERSAALDACGRLHQAGVGLAAALGDPGSLRAALDLAQTRTAAIAAAMAPIAAGKRRDVGGLPVVSAPEPLMTGAVASLTMLFLGRPDRPVVGLATIGDRLKVSTRATKALVGQGLDLHEACRSAAAAVAGDGGGHPVSAGALVPASRTEEFLALLAARVGSQLGWAQTPAEAADA